MFVCCECCCVLSCRGLCVRLNHSSRGVLPSVVCLSVIVNPRQREGPAPLGAVAPWKKVTLHKHLSFAFMGPCIAIICQ